MAEYTDLELANALRKAQDYVDPNHSSYGCVGCGVCTYRTMLDLAADRLEQVDSGLVGKAEVLEVITTWDREIDNRQQNDMPGFVRHYTPTLIARIEEL